MEHQDQNIAMDKVLAFDTLFTTNHIKMLKVLLFFLDSPMQKMLAIYIKILELHYVLTYFDAHSSIGLGKLDFNDIYKEILPYCGQKDRKIIEQFSRMQQMMEQFQQISQTMEMMKELFPDGIPGFDFNSDFCSGSDYESSADSESDSGSKSNNFMPFSTDFLCSMMGGGENSQMFEMLTAMMDQSQK